MLVLGFSDYHDAGDRLAAALACPFHCIEVHRFPDGEHRLRLPPGLPEHVVVCRCLSDPNAKLVDLLLLAATARDLGARRLTLAAPYLCYMRQDAAFQPGEAVSQRIVGRLLADLFDEVITVDAHLHRISKLAEAVPAERALSLSPAFLMAEFIRTQALQEALLLGPDEESAPWVKAIADIAGNPFAVAAKTRMNDASVRITLPDIEIAARTVLLVDDMISTGRTVAETAGLLLAGGAAAVDCLVTHALMAADAKAVLAQAGVRRIVSTDSVPDESNRIALAGLLAEAIDGHRRPVPASLP